MTGPDVALDLTVSQGRVLGALLEKELVTPDAYPLTLKALAAACNQISDRDPVIRFELQQVETAALALKSKGLLRLVHPGAGERATRYRQVLDEAFELRAGHRALIGLLLLRGPQTAAELRARAERMYPFPDGAAVESVLADLAGREPALVSRLQRQPGQKTERWAQLLESEAPAPVASERGVFDPRHAAPAPYAGPAPAPDVSLETAGHPSPAPYAPAPDAPAPLSGSPAPGSVGGPALAALELRVAALESLVGELLDALGDLVQIERPPPAGS